MLFLAAQKNSSHTHLFFLHCMVLGSNVSKNVLLSLIILLLKSKYNIILKWQHCYISVIWRGLVGESNSWTFSNVWIFVLFHSCCSHAEVFRNAFVHKFLIPCIHTEWYLLFYEVKYSLLCQSLTMIIIFVLYISGILMVTRKITLQYWEMQLPSSLCQLGLTLGVRSTRWSTGQRRN